MSRISTKHTCTPNYSSVLPQQCFKVVDGAFTVYWTVLKIIGHKFENNELVELHVKQLPSGSEHVLVKAWGDFDELFFNLNEAEARVQEVKIKRCKE